MGALVSLGCSSVVEQTALNRPTGVRFPPPLPRRSRSKAGRRTLTPSIRVRVPAPVPMPRRSPGGDACLSRKSRRVRFPSEAPNAFVPIVYRPGRWVLNPESRVQLPVGTPRKVKWQRCHTGFEYRRCASTGVRLLLLPPMEDKSAVVQSPVANRCEPARAWGSTPLSSATRVWVNG